MLHQLACCFVVVLADGVVDRRKGPDFSSQALNTAVEPGPGRPGTAGIDYTRQTTLSWMDKTPWAQPKHQRQRDHKTDEQNCPVETIRAVPEVLRLRHRLLGV